MDSSVAAKERARKKVGIADHILTQTYPLVKDPKLLIAVLQNLVESIDQGMKAWLLAEYEEKRGPPVSEEYGSRLIAFKQQIVPRHNIPGSFLRFVSELRETVREHRKSPVEFVRKEEFVICDESYRVRTLSVEQLKGNLQRTKEFVRLMEEKTNDAVITQRH